MRRLAFLGLMMIVGLFAGLLVVSANHLLGAFMGAVIGAAAAVIVLAFPRHNGEPSDHDFWFGD